jgi:hypothetical protein
MDSRKYPRTYHFPFSPGTTSDDRIAKSFDKILTEEIVITEKLDGENTCLNKSGVFSRSHTSPTRHPWANYMWDYWQNLRQGLGDLEIFGESLYAVHSIEYTGLNEYFYVFAIREGSQWLAWEQVVEYAEILQFPTVPVLFKGKIAELEPVGMENGQKIENLIQEILQKPSYLTDESLGKSPKEGIVARITQSFSDEAFAQSVIKWVRKNHVQTDKHWTKNWRRAKLNFELKAQWQKKMKELDDLKKRNSNLD